MKYLLIALTFSIQVLYAQQGIKGKVEYLSGNQMPGPGKTLTKPQPVVREIYIYEPASLQQATSNGGGFFSKVNTKLVATIKSEKDGSFSVKLPPGEYSVFVKEEQGLYANGFDSDNRIQCVSVKKGKFTMLNLLLNYQAAY